MSFTLRDYQQEASDIAVNRMNAGSKPFIIQAATGAGKSLIIADICHKLDRPVLVLQPSKELIEQNYDKLLSYGIKDIGMYSASKNRKEIRKFTYATIGSVYKKPEEFKHFKDVIIDEAHGMDPKNKNGMYFKFLKAIGARSVCGLTATPYRIVQKYVQNGFKIDAVSQLAMLNRIYPPFFKEIAYSIETAELIEKGYLSPVKYVQGEVDLKKLRSNTTGAEFSDSSIRSFWSDKRVAELAHTIAEIDNRCQKNLIFCSTIEQASAMVKMIKEEGLSAAIVTGETPKKEREDIVERFRSGEIRHLANVGVFTTGFDVPDLDSIVLARPTMSLALYYQMVGRGIRLDPSRPDKVLTVYDYAGCVQIHGTVESIRLVKEDGFKDAVESDTGIRTGVPLFQMTVKDNTPQEAMEFGSGFIK